jgi:hypothetical protein
MLEATGFALITLYLLGMMSPAVLWAFVEILIVLAVGIILLKSVQKPRRVNHSLRKEYFQPLSLGRFRV